MDFTAIRIAVGAAFDTRKIATAQGDLRQNGCQAVETRKIGTARGDFPQIVRWARLRAGVRARRASTLLGGAIAIGLLAAGCGAGSPTRSSKPGTGAALALARCMRGHGVPNFPDPGSSISGPYNSIGGVEIPATIDMRSPAFEAAQQACHGLLSAVLSPQGRPKVTASLKAALIAHAQCMRTHGVSSYPDPTFPASGGIAITDAGTDPQSPAYQHAQSVCQSR